jgi:hypothetical protein
MGKNLPTRARFRRKTARHAACIGRDMMNFKNGDGTFRGLLLGTALAALMILGINLLGRWDQQHRADADGARSVLRIAPRCGSGGA